MKIRVKICCIGSPEEARLAISFGAAALGLVGQMPSGPGVISDARIAEIAAQTPPGVATFLLSSETSGPAVLAHQLRTHTNTLQLVDQVPTSTYHAVRTALPALKIVQVIHVLDEASVGEALAAAEYVDALLLDSGNPKLSVKELGGTGRTHDWSLSRRIVEQSAVPVYLAGGLHAGNVQEAIEKVQPFGLDLCSGVRTQGALDPYKLEQFFNAVYA
ncbi:MAG: phosphoribosylanthranilate isomerase [Saprospiraceae bacterium]|nr:phosphoribosylanthranilate isomerase [Saprospiraceae bacterium]